MRRANNDIFEVAVSPTTGNYLYYNNSSVFGHINTTNSTMSWFINSSGLASLPNLAINSPNIRGTGDLLTVSVTPTGNYIYLNNGGVLGGYNASGIPSNFPWTIDMVGLGSFRSISTPVANITTDNVGTLNVSGTATITKLSINSTMRSNNDLFNCSTSSTGPYLFIANDATIGTYNTNNSTFPWFVEMDGDATFQTINCPNTTTTSKLTVTNTKYQVIVRNTPTVNLTITSPQMIYLSSDVTQYVLFEPLGVDYNFNIYEFRITTQVTVIFQCTNCDIVDLDNVSRSSFTNNATKKYFKFQYIYQFPGQSVINTYYQLA